MIGLPAGKALLPVPDIPVFQIYLCWSLWVRAGYVFRRGTCRQAATSTVA